MIKSVKNFLNITSITGTTVNQPLAVESGLYSQYGKMDVVALVNTLTINAGGGVTISVLENFPANVLNQNTFITTAKFVNISSQGAYFATYDNSNLQAGTPYASPGTQQNSMLGKGLAKQIVTTANSVTALNADIIFVYHN